MPPYAAMPRFCRQRTPLMPLPRHYAEPPPPPLTPPDAAPRRALSAPRDERLRVMRR
jgi:hypothetical protein